MTDYKAQSNDFVINSYFTGDQAVSSVVGLSGGGYVVIWQSYGQDGDQKGIYGQLFTDDNLKVGDEFLVNTATPGSQGDPMVIALTGGGFLATWTDDPSSCVVGQLYSNAGDKVGAEIQLNPSALGGEKNWQSVSALTNGGFVATWSMWYGDGSNYGVFGQRYASDGSRVGSEFGVNTYKSGWQGNSSAAGLSDGGFVVAWQSDGQDGSSYGVYGQRFASNGTKTGAEFAVNTFTLAEQNAVAMAALEDGGFVITWQSAGADGSGFAISGQRYNSGGDRIGGEFIVNSYSTGNQSAPSVVGLADGGFMVTWTSNGQDGSSTGIFGQRYSANGERSGNEWAINKTTNLAQAESCVTTLENGSLVVTWTSNATTWGDTNGNGIYGRRFSPVGVSIKNTTAIEGAKAIFTWNLDQPAEQSGYFIYGLVEGSADFPSDYGNAMYPGVRLPYGMVSICQGQSSGTIAIDTYKDNITEGSETFTLKVFQAVGVAIGDGEAVATITEPRGKPILFLSGGEAIEGEDVTFTWTLSQALEQDTVIRYRTSTSTGSAKSSDFAGVSNGSFTIQAGETSGQIAIQTTSDSKPEGNETFQLTLLPSLGNPQTLTILGGTATGTIKDFKYTGQSAEELFAHNGAYEDGKYASLAGFAKAAYVNKTGGTVANWQGWTPLTAAVLGLAERGAAKGSETLGATGSYTFQNGVFAYHTGTKLDDSLPLAIVARCEDALVISFRGTVSRETDGTDWFDVNDHYDKFTTLIEALDQYIANPANGIETVYVTGHSLGGGTAEEFMYEHKDKNGVEYEAVVFASPGASILHNRDDKRIFAFEIDGDLTPDKAPTGHNAGTFVHYSHDHDGQYAAVQMASFHAMSLYESLTMTMERDGFAFDELNDGDNRQDNHSVMVALTTVNHGQVVSIMDTDNRLEEDADFLFGALGNDTLEGGNDENTLFGCGGNDFLEGQEENDTLFGGSGSDTYFFDDPSWVGGIGNDLVYDESGGLDTILMGDWANDLDTLYTFDDDIFFDDHEYDLAFSLDGDDLLINFTIDSDSLDVGSAESEGEIRIQDMGEADHRIESLFLEDTGERVSLLAIYEALNSVVPDSTKWTIFETTGSNEDNGGYGKSVNYIAQV
jgi:pimeloyl-ACP methyl ester carboxylesterase